MSESEDACLYRKLPTINPSPLRNGVLTIQSDVLIPRSEGERGRIQHVLLDYALVTKYLGKRAHHLSIKTTEAGVVNNSIHSNMNGCARTNATPRTIYCAPAWNCAASGLGVHVGEAKTGAARRSQQTVPYD